MDLKFPIFIVQMKIEEDTYKIIKYHLVFKDKVDIWIPIVFAKHKTNYCQQSPLAQDDIGLFNHQYNLLETHEIYLHKILMKETSQERFARQTLW